MASKIAKGVCRYPDCTRVTANKTVRFCKDHIQVSVLQHRISVLEDTRGPGLQDLLSRYPEARRLLEILADLTRRAAPLKGASVEVVARSRGHGLGDGIVVTGSESDPKGTRQIARPGYAMATKSAEGDLGAARGIVKGALRSLEKLADPNLRRVKDTQRCQRSGCVGGNRRQPIELRFCGYCGRSFLEEAESA